jgi:hypothetical protein
VPRHPDCSIETDPVTFRGLVFGDRKLSDSSVELRGDKRTARTFFRLFPRPRALPEERG